MWLGAIACVLAAAALMVGVVALVAAHRGPAPVPEPMEPVAIARDLLLSDADKALFEEIGPLLKEQTDRAKAFVVVPGSAEHRAAISKMKSGTLDWYGRVQQALNSNMEPQRYLMRTVQAYIDGMLLYTENLHDDRGPDPYDDDAYTSAMVSVGGPLGGCYKLGPGGERGSDPLPFHKRC